MPKLEEDDDRQCSKRADEEGDEDGKEEDKYNEDETRALDKVLELMMSTGMEREFEEFAEKYVDAFEEAAQTDARGESVEFKLEHHDLYRRYLITFEKKVTDYIEGEGFTLEQFYDQCSTVLARNREWDPRRYFIEALLSTTEFEMFMHLMIGEARRLALERRGGVRK